MRFGTGHVTKKCDHITVGTLMSTIIRKKNVLKRIENVSLEYVRRRNIHRHDLNNYKCKYSWCTLRRPSWCSKRLVIYSYLYEYVRTENQHC